MKQLSSFLTERKGEKAHKEAEQMGLQYKGFGYWVDPKSGKVTHQTQGDSLVPVDPDVETDMYKGGKGPEEQGMPGAPGSNDPLRGPKGQDLRGMNVGDAPEPGEERPGDINNSSWEPGPDGDNCVTDQPPPDDIPTDSFVGKSNYHQWVAGPDGSDAINEDQRNQGGARTMMGQMLAKKTPGLSNPTMRDANQALKQMDDGQSVNPALANQVASMMRIRDRNKERTYDDTLPSRGTDRDNLEMGKQNDMWRKAIKLPAIAKDNDAVKQMNQQLQTLVSDGNYDLDDVGEEIGEGAFGRVFMGKDGKSVVKQGGIGPDELKALHAMKNNPHFPTLINARFTEPFKHQSSMYNNPMGGEDAREPNMSDYWDPDDQSDFDKKFPTAQGIYAMSKADGEPLSDAFFDMDEDRQEKARNKIWKLRSELHKAGFSHNDMHGGNIFVNKKGDANILDLGLAKDDPLSALMEGMGGVSMDDYQLTNEAGIGKLPTKLRDMLNNNREGVREMLENSFDIDDQEFDFDNGRRAIEDMMGGDIRMTGEMLNQFREDVPALQKREFVMGLIDKLYDGVGSFEQQDTMAKAYDRLRNQPHVKDFEDIRGKLKQIGNPLGDKLKMKGLDLDD